jgi:hypothetical protein
VPSHATTMARMTAAAQPLFSQSPAPSNSAAPEGWDTLRSADDIQFAPVQIDPVAPPELGAFEKFLIAVFETLAQWLGPVGQWLGGWWWLIQWVLIAAVAGFVLYVLARTFAPVLLRPGQRGTAAASEWWPDTAASLALLEEADRLAALGQYDAATHLLLTRSVGEMAAARPDWVEPSSTARELSALPALPDAAREAFRVIAERVERSLFARCALEHTDWQVARDAYARFALALPRGASA